MIKIEKTETFGWEAAIRGARNPLNSWGRSDSEMKHSVLKMEEFAPGCSALVEQQCEPFISIGENDYDLLMRLSKAGADHSKYMRMITVYADITAPLYWWKEFDTYKVGTVANSCSTMHKIHAKEFALDDFSHEHLIDITNIEPEHPELLMDVTPHQDGSICFSPGGMLNLTITMLNMCREKYIETKDKKYWWQMIQLLPSSYNQKRTVMLNYAVLANQYKSRKNHKLDEWHAYCEWIELLPHSTLITCEEPKL